MNRRISAITAACIAVVSVTACGDTWQEKERKIDNLAVAAYNRIDDDFIGIISNNPEYCLDDEAKKYRQKLMKNHDVDLEWFIVADRGNIKVYYSKDWESPAHLAGAIEDSESVTLGEMYDDKLKMIEKSRKESEPANAQTTTATQIIPETTTTTAKSSAPPHKTVNGLRNVTLKTGGDTFTVAAWNPDDVPVLLQQWEKNTGYSYDNVDFINFDCGGGDASERYDQLFVSGEDLDVYFCEADWALKYINNDTRTAPLEALGFSDADFADAYAYTVEIGRATSGKNAGKIVGASWQAAPGAFAYRTDLAEQYLGVKTPEEMQAKICNWDEFVSTAVEVAFHSEEKVALADSVWGLWQAFSDSRTQPWIINNEVVFGDSCKKFADYAKTLWDFGGVTHNDQWSDSWFKAGKKGSCMGYFVSTWGFSEWSFFGQISSESYGKWAVCEGPSPYFWGGTWIVVNPATDNAEEVQSFIYNATVDSVAMKEFALGKPEYVNNVVVMEEIINNKEVLNEWITDDLGGQNYFEVLDKNVKAIDLNGIITPYDGMIKSAFLNAVCSIYLQGGSYDETIEYAMKFISIDD